MQRLGDNFSRGDFLRNLLFIICIMTLMLFIIKPYDGEVIRLRVIANSDSVADQSEKMRVVKALDTLFDKQSFKTLDEAGEWISLNMAEIENTCASVWGGDFNAEMRREKYDDGEYNSLVVTLGEGRGHNFWGTLFPDISRRMSGAESSKFKPFRVISRGGELIEIRFLTFEQILNIF